MSNIIKIEQPTKKGDSITDFANLSLLELEDELRELFPDGGRLNEHKFYNEIISAVIFRIVCAELPTDEIIDYLIRVVDENVEIFNELEEEETSSH